METREVFVWIKHKENNIGFSFDTDKPLDEVHKYYSTYWVIASLAKDRSVSSTMSWMTWLFLGRTLDEIFTNSYTITVRVFETFEEATSDDIFWKNFSDAEDAEDAEDAGRDSLKIINDLIATMRKSNKFTADNINDMVDLKNKIQYEENSEKKAKLIKKTVTTIMTAMIDNDII